MEENVWGEDELWYTYDMSMPRDYKTCIMHLQKAYRATLEYDDWQRTAKWAHAIYCPVCKDNYFEKNMKCESHHHPKKLSTIIEEIIDKHLEDNDLDKCSGMDIMTEIMQLHLVGNVSYINLCVHCHKKFHDGHPDVVNEIHNIFEGWAKAGQSEYEKDHTIKELPEELILTTKEEILEIEKVQELNIEEKDISIIELPLDISIVPPAPIIEVQKDISEIIPPNSVHYETSTGFKEIPIDINELV